MTRYQFREEVNDWYALIDVCLENGCCLCDDIVDRYTLDDSIETDLQYLVNNGSSWGDILEGLSGIDTGYDFYKLTGTLEYEGLDDRDLEDYKADVLDWMDDHEYWDEDDDEEESAFFLEEASEPEVEQEDFTVSDLMSMCGSELVAIQRAGIQRREEESENVARLLAV